MAWFVKYRPATFEDMVGHKAVVSSVRGQLEKEDKPKAWLFTGQSGIGKTTIARVLAKAFGATVTGIIEQNSANIRGIDGVRALTKQTLFKTPGSPVTVVILDECHQLTTDAQNALLKALEDTPAHVYYILCTTEPEKLIETVRQRCLQYKFGPLIPEEAELLLWTVAEKENLTLTDEIAQAIVARSNGSPRLTLNMLEKVAPVCPDYHQVLELIDGMAQDNAIDGQANVGLTILDMMYGKSKCEWKTMVKFLTDRVLYKKEDINAIKRGLIYQFGKKLLYLPNIWLSQSAQKLEFQLLGANTDGAFIALMYEIWRDCPITEIQAPVQRQKPALSATDSNFPTQPSPLGVRQSGNPAKSKIM